MYALGGGTLKTVELNIRSVLKEARDPQDSVPKIRQEPGEPLAAQIPPPTQPEDPSDDESVVDQSEAWENQLLNMKIHY